MKIIVILAAYASLCGCIVGGTLVGGTNENIRVQTQAKESVSKPLVYCEKTGTVTKYCGKTSAEQAQRVYEAINRNREYSRF